MARSEAPVHDPDYTMPHHRLPTNRPLASAEPLADQPFDVERIPQGFCPIVRQRLIVILLDDQGKLADSKKDGQELGADAGGGTAFHDLPVRCQVFTPASLSAAV
jgi:hypothetical protein